MFSYDFVSLSPEQVEARRRQLNQAGYQAFIAPILLLILVYSFRRLTSPANHVSEENSRKPGLFIHLSRSISWLIDTTYIPEFGPLKIQLIGLLYTVFLLWRITYQTGNDYMHVTKAFGHVAVSQLPMHYLLSMKWPYSPITIATGLTHERLNSYHRLFGRIVHSLLATHAILYLRFFIKMDLLPKRIKDTDVRLGIIAFWSMNFLALLSIPPIRKRAYYALFYRSHMILSGVLVPVLWYHVTYTRIYVAQAAIIWLLNSILRNGTSLPATISSTSVSPNLVRVKATITGHHLYPYLPGVHIYLNLKPFGPRTPFTVLNARALSTTSTTEIDLIAKTSHGPMTSTLAALASQPSPSAPHPTFHLEGPYGDSQLSMPPLLHLATLPPAVSGKFLIVAGGIGATHSLPIYTALCTARVRAAQPADDIRMLWLIRDETDIVWASAFREACVKGNFRPPFIRITSPENKAKVASSPKHRVPEIARGTRAEMAGLVDDFVNERLVGDGFGDELVKRPAETVDAERKRVEQRLFTPVTVLVCGPGGLVRDLRRVVGRYVYRDGRDVRWYEEAFGFGGS